MINEADLMRAVQQFEPLPQGVARLASLAAGDDPDVDGIVEVVRFDPKFTAIALRAANSASSGSIEPISDARSAVMRLGPSTIVTLVMSTAVQAQLTSPLSAYQCRSGVLWKHSVAVAIGAEVLSEFASQPIPPESFTAALLHDIGRIAIDSVLDRDQVAHLREACDEGQLVSIEAERELLGAHHGEIGALIAQEWELPDSITSAIQFHHESHSGNSLAGNVVLIAETIASELGFGVELDDSRTREWRGAMSRIGVDTVDWDQIRNTVHERILALASRYGA